MSELVYSGARIYLDNYDYLLNNVFMFDWESDLFGISKTGYAVEIEIKISRGDYFQDFKKPKHRLFEERQGLDNVPNKFLYACPEGLIDPAEVPEYAGLIYTGTKYSSFSVRKAPPFIHKNKIDFTERLLSKYYNTSINTRARINEMIYKINQYGMTEDEVKDNLKNILRKLK